MKTTMKAIGKHYNKVIKYYPKEQVLGVFCYGSQNYGFNTPDSDVDTKAIIVPTIEDLCLRQPISRELHLDNGEHCEVKDIREMVNMFKKQNINFIEILFTDYYLINPKYNTIWKKYFTLNAEKIAHYDERKTVLSICGQALNTLKQSLNNECNGKKFANALRLYHFLRLYLNGANYNYCIDIQHSEAEKLLFDYKTNKIIPPKEAIEFLIERFKILKENAPETKSNTKTLEILNQGISALITNDNINFDFYK